LRPNALERVTQSINHQGPNLITESPQFGIKRQNLSRDGDVGSAAAFSATGIFADQRTANHALFSATASWRPDAAHGTFWYNSMCGNGLNITAKA
jgi:hypothetical protein